MQRPLATVVIGGIISSTILTLSSAFTMKLFFAAYTRRACSNARSGRAKGQRPASPPIPIGFSSSNTTSSYWRWRLPSEGNGHTLPPPAVAYPPKRALFLRRQRGRHIDLRWGWPSRELKLRDRVVGSLAHFRTRCAARSIADEANLESSHASALS